MWALIQFDWCPVKKRRWGHTEEHRDAHVEKGPCEDTALCRPGERPQEKTNLPTGSWTCSLQSCENINPCCFSPPACGTLLWQLTQTSMCSDQHVPLCYVVRCVYVGKRWEGYVWLLWGRILFTTQLGCCPLSLGQTIPWCGRDQCQGWRGNRIRDVG